MAKIQSAIASQYPKAVVPLIDAAALSIDILMYLWKWYGHESAGGVQKLNLALVAAARRGVKVRALLNQETMGHPITKINGRTANLLQRYGVEVKFAPHGQVTHVKTMIIDDRILILGSHNYSKAAFSRNQEASIIVEGAEEIKPYCSYFQGLWDQFF